MPWLAVIDFLQDWDIGTLILAAFVASLLVLAGSFGLATAWRRWKEARRRRARAERDGALAARASPTAEGKGGKAAVLRKLPKPSLPKMGKPSLPGLRRKEK